MTRWENGGLHTVKSPWVVSNFPTWANRNRNAARPQVAIIASRVSVFITSNQSTPQSKLYAYVAISV